MWRFEPVNDAARRTVTRVEVIGDAGRLLTLRPCILDRVDCQDDGRTLKVFVKQDDAVPLADLRNRYELLLAENLARKGHLKQVDKNGEPYILHVERVAKAVAHISPRVEAVGWLHDLIEDTPIGCDDLRQAGIPDQVIVAVDVLTRPPLGEYADYIKDVKASGNKLALAVKLADLHDHLNHGRCPESLVPRYQAALEFLEAQ